MGIPVWIEWRNGDRQRSLARTAGRTRIDLKNLDADFEATAEVGKLRPIVEPDPSVTTLATVSRDATRTPFDFS